MKSSLLTDYEYASMWDPQPDTIRFGVLLSFNAIDHYLEASTLIRMAVDDINRQRIIPEPRSLYAPSGGAAAIAGDQALISGAGVIGDIYSDLMRGYLRPEYGWVTMSDISETLRKEPDHTDYDELIMLDNDYDLTGYPAYDKFMEQWMALGNHE
ncbi:hypothetical protein BG015_007122 [Linnemannia schmuckeri]|uniref:Uncharacterized protein n=1 Tax=Linnemannia schmuckeri TaxID=64567 RepID=A0A9P5S168_9FUNG|nr:hypothetical protein BG015_007122 [Linnemannia schmuckeri]